MSMWHATGTWRSYGSNQYGCYRSGGFSPAEINRIANLVEEHREAIIEVWDGHFGT